MACNSDTLFIVAEDANNPADKDAVLGKGVTWIDIDPNTGEVVPRNPFNAASAPGTYLTETYSGFCVDARGITSNTVSFKVLTYYYC